MPNGPPDIVHASEIVAASVFLLVTGGTGGLSAYVVGRWAWLGRRETGLLRDSLRVRGAAAAVLAIGVACAIWGWCVEPRMLGTTRLQLEAPRPDIGPTRATRIAFVTDFHVEPGWYMEGKLAARVAELAPDVVLLGGDYANLCAPPCLEMLAAEVRGLAGVAPVYAVLGNVDAFHPEVRGILMDSGARLIEDEWVELAWGVHAFGAGYLDGSAVERAARETSPRRFDICLTHAPGLIPDAARSGFDLYLCGHTHGGQVRLPLWGALLTLSVHGKRFEYGRYRVEGMTAFVSRGVGLEAGRLAPRVRFLCAPEVLLVEIKPVAKR